MTRSVQPAAPIVHCAVRTKLDAAALNAAAATICGDIDCELASATPVATQRSLTVIDTETAVSWAVGLVQVVEADQPPIPHIALSCSIVCKDDQPRHHNMPRLALRSSSQQAGRVHRSSVSQGIGGRTASIASRDLDAQLVF